MTGIKKLLLAGLWLSVLHPANLMATTDDLTQYVNPLIGTGAIDNDSYMGCTFPGATVPFGMVQLSPDTQFYPHGLMPSGYDYNHNRIYGFSHTHLSGTGAIDLLDILFMPSSRSIDDLCRTDDYSLPFRHCNEKAQAGYYEVEFDSAGIRAELTATVRTGIHRYSYAKDKEHNLVVDMHHAGNFWLNKDGAVIDASLRLIDPTTLVGYRSTTGWSPTRRIYFCARFSKPVKDIRLKQDKHVMSGSTAATGRDVKAMLHFDGSDTPLVVNVGISAVSIEGAQANMKAEAPDHDFDTYREKAHDLWQQILEKIEVEGTEQQKRIFYTGMYHAFLQPNTFSDADGHYPRHDRSAAQLEHGQRQYTTLSIWDTYRALNPLYTILTPDRVAEITGSMIRQYDELGFLPVWQLWGSEIYCMIGNHSVPIIADAVLKNIPGIDAEKAYQAVKGSLTTNHKGSPAEDYARYGYVPADIYGQSVSMTLEMAYDDACAARMAKALGKDRDYHMFTQRSRNYRNLFDPETGFFRPRDSRGRWIEPFNPLAYGANGDGPFTEGNAWQYLWYVPHDIEDMIRLFGGKKSFERKLDKFFTLEEGYEEKNGNASGFIGQYAHGNEPSHHCAYLYNYIGCHDKTARYVNEVINRFYNDSISGYAGNEDCGEMSAWYIWSAMGLYPTDPASGIYDLGSPQFRKVTINLSEGRTFVIETDRKLQSEYKIKSARLNGKRLDRRFITHEEIMAGGKLTISTNSGK